MKLRVNGIESEVAVDDQDAFLHVLRNKLSLRGAHYGCGAEHCGACMVAIDGAPVPACTYPAAQAEGKSITTVEGLAEDGAVVRAFEAEQAGQCGYCLPGILISVQALLWRNPTPKRGDILAALEPHLCRCGAHPSILRAVERAVAEIVQT
ncbi:MAG: 2Fe-2S iron-sulfur cluster-binding protein [Maricaulaceae bacterium]|jgi:nicotinate dehydrogenase subunit A